MDYYDEIAAWLVDGDTEEFFKWLASFDLLEQVEILRQAKMLFQEIAKERPNDLEILELVAVFGENIEAYQEAVLTELLAKQQLDMAVEKRDASFAEMDRITQGIREYVIECIVTNADNAKEMRGLADKMIELEKDSGTYDPENWKEIL